MRLAVGTRSAHPTCLSFIVRSLCGLFDLSPYSSYCYLCWCFPYMSLFASIALISLMFYHRKSRLLCHLCLCTTSDKTSFYFVDSSHLTVIRISAQPDPINPERASANDMFNTGRETIGASGKICPVFNSDNKEKEPAQSSEYSTASLCVYLTERKV